MPNTRNRIDYFELKKRLKFVNKPMFEFCGAYVYYLDSYYGLKKNDPKINKLCSKQPLFMQAIDARTHGGGSGVQGAIVALKDGKIYVQADR